MELKNNMTLAEVKEWLEEQGAICRPKKLSELKCVVNIDHIKPGNWAAFLVWKKDGEKLLVQELTYYFPSENEAWRALSRTSPSEQRSRLFTNWLSDQYILDRNATVERLEI